MNKKVRLDSVEVDGYYFPSINGLTWHSGSFWYNEFECKVVYNNGSKSVVINGTKRGVKKLRVDAVKCTIKISKSGCPF